MSNKRYSKYKPSPLPWNKEIPEHWISRRGKFIFKVINQRSVAGAEELLSVTENWGVIPRKNANVTMFQAESYEGYKLCQKGDLVINSLWAWGKGLGFSEYAGIVSTAYSVYRLKKHSEHNYRYFNYLLRTPGYVGEYLVRSKGVWISRLQLSDMAFLDMQIVIPPVEEQTAIADYLDTQNEKINLFIANKKKLIELLKLQKQAIINEIINESEGQLKNSKRKKLKFVSKVLRGKFTHRPRNDERLYDGQYPFIQTNNVTSAKKFIETYSQTLNDWGYSVSKEFPPNTVVMTIAANIADVAILNFTACFPDSMIGFVPTKEIDTEFLYYSLISKRDYFFSIATISTQLNLNIDKVGNVYLLIPSIEEQHLIVKKVIEETEKIDLVITRTEKEIELIKEYRQSIIAEVVTGKIKVT
jgi:type I restriction enzyme S subunit